MTAQLMSEPGRSVAETLRDVAVECLQESVTHQFPIGLREIGRTIRRPGASANSFPSKLSILMRVYNEETTIIQAIIAVLKAGSGGGGTGT
jgi:hypothetical protein